MFQGFALMSWESLLHNVTLGLRHKRPELNRKQRAEIGLEYLEKVGLCGCRLIIRVGHGLEESCP